MTIADIADNGRPTGHCPFRLTAFDGSSAGPAGCTRTAHQQPAGADLRAHRARRSRPGAGLRQRRHRFHRDASGRPLRTAQADGRRTAAAPAVARRAARTCVAGVGLKTLLPVAPPPQEATPRWRRVAQGLGHSKKRDSSAISKHYDVSNTFYEYVLGPSMTYTCAVYPIPGRHAGAGPGRQARPGLRQAGPAARPATARRRLRLGVDGPARGPARRAGARRDAVPAAGGVGPEGHRRRGSAAPRGDPAPGLPGCRRRPDSTRSPRSG